MWMELFSCSLIVDYNWCWRWFFYCDHTWSYSICCHFWIRYDTFYSRWFEIVDVSFVCGACLHIFPNGISFVENFALSNLVLDRNLFSYLICQTVLSKSDFNVYQIWISLMYLNSYRKYLHKILLLIIVLSGSKKLSKLQLK